MPTLVPPSPAFQPECLRRHGFTEPGSESGLRDLLQLAATFCDAPAVLALQDETGLWFCKGVGLSPGDLAELEASLGQAFASAQEPVPIAGAGLVLVAGLWLLDAARRPMGCLCVLAPQPMVLSAAQQAGLKQLVAQLAGVVLQRQAWAERRGASRREAGASFLPGLVHELRNFSFGISGSLDAFQARVAGQETSRYGAVMRGSLDSLNAFIEELREYGESQPLAWAEVDLEPLLREAIAHQLGLAERCQVTLALEVAEPLPLVRADARSLRTAIIRLLDLALRQEGTGGRVVVRVGCQLEGKRRVLRGQLDTGGLRLHLLELERLFEPFYYRAAGLGRLALPVARRSFEAHGGTLTAVPGPGGSLRLGFQLPVPATDPRLERP